MTDTVIPIRPKAEKDMEAELEAERSERIHAFDNLFGSLLKAQAEAMRWGSSDEATDKAVQRLDDLMWRIIQSPAPLSRHVELKFLVLYLDMDDIDLPRSHRAMLDSIRNDVQGGFDE